MESPAATCTLFTIPERGAVTLVSIFMASMTMISSFSAIVCPGATFTLLTMPDIGLRQNLSSSPVFSEFRGCRRSHRMHCRGNQRIRHPVKRMMRNFVIFDDFDLHLVGIAVNSNLELQVILPSLERNFLLVYRLKRGL